jgi:RNA polymerase sigma-70 factor (ECF subfamily)
VDADASYRTASESSEDQQLTARLRAWAAGSPGALDELMPLVVADLRRLAAAVSDRDADHNTLQPTALVNELYLHLRARRVVSWRDRSHFFGYAATAMRRLLVDRARARQAEKRGSGLVEGLDSDSVAAVAADADLLVLDDALAALARRDERQAKVVELRFFVGLTEVQVAAVLGLSERTVRREWQTARLWLAREVGSLER